MFKILNLAIIAVAASGTSLSDRFKNAAKLQDSQDWPNVTFPDNFRVDFTLNKVDNETQQLIQFQNTSSYQLFDSQGNRILTVTNTLSKDQQTMEKFSIFANLSTGQVTFIGKEQCNNMDINHTISLSDLLAEIRDPEGFITTYVGRVQLPYAGDIWFNQFSLSLLTASGIVFENIFFGEDDGEFKYFNYEMDPDTVYKASGMIPQTFTDEDFENYTTCNSPSETTPLSTATLALY